MNIAFKVTLIFHIEKARQEINYIQTVLMEQESQIICLRAQGRP